MCGIVGYIGARQAPDVVMGGLKKLEYRGYDSAGVAVLENGRFSIRRDIGKLHNLEETLRERPLIGNVGIGHTRWATHGAPTENNAHPHMSMNGRVVVVHNGIVENFIPLRDALQAEGIVFQSDTDTEVIVQMIERYIEAGEGFETAVRLTIAQLKGASAIVVLSRDNPNLMVCARLGNAGGIAIGLGEDEIFLASDIPAILEYTRDMIFLENRQMARLERGGCYVTDLDGNPMAIETHRIAWDPVSAAKGEYKHFMQKEIFDQPRSIIDTIRGRVDFEKGTVMLPEMNLTPELVGNIKKLFIVACGTSFYSGLAGKVMIESIARLPTEVAYASEFRYADPIVDAETAVLTITQSGETADTLAAAELAKSRGATMWTIVNALGSQSMRLSHGHIAMQAGPEIGVASTKAFTTSLVDQYLLACALGQLRGTITPARGRELVAGLAQLPDLIGQALEQDAAYAALANQFFKVDNFLYLGRGINYAVAREGALKLKEISYIHAEGYPAGEMKHGPIALIDEAMPVFVIATQDHLYDKMISQVRQAKARGGVVIAVATAGDTAMLDEADHVLFVPPAPPLLAAVMNVIPMQLFAYHVAVRRGADVDQPRNLAKSVTVE